MYTLIDTVTGTQPVDKKAATVGFPRGFDHTFDVSERGLAWAVAEQEPHTGPFERAVKSDTATKSPDGSWTYKWNVEPIDPVRIQNMIKAERARRLPLDFEFQGKMYQRDEESVRRISGAGTLALGAMVKGAQVGDYLWHGRTTPFAWIASDDTLTQMDAQTVYAFGAAAAARETEIVFAAKSLREMDPIPDDFTDDKWWT